MAGIVFKIFTPASAGGDSGDQGEDVEVEVDGDAEVDDVDAVLWMSDVVKAIFSVRRPSREVFPFVSFEVEYINLTISFSMSTLSSDFVDLKLIATMSFKNKVVKKISLIIQFESSNMPQSF